MFSHPDQIEQVLRSRHDDFIKWKFLRDTRGVFGQGLLTNEGDSWKQQRKLMTPAFQLKQLTGYAANMVDCTRRLLEGWRAGQTLVISDDMRQLTLAILGKTLFDVDVEADSHQLGPVLGSVMDYFGSTANTLVLPHWAPTPANLRLRRALRSLDQIVRQMIADRRNRGLEGKDLLSRLLAMQDEAGARMTDRQIRDELVTLAFAGHKTTAAALTYSLYLLSQSPQTEARLAEEIANALGGRPPSADDVPKLRFAECVIKEALRLYPPSWGIGREAIRDCEIGGWPVPKGTQVMTVQYVVQRDRRWFDRPNEFLPERWESDLEERLPRCAYFPFGAGPRICIGGHFAMLETVLLLATIMQRFRLELAPGQNFRLVPSITLWPRPGIQMKLRDRED
jgi:cytochrome P450